jgi:D-threo-aldose 1-dehydrogenase
MTEKRDRISAIAQRYDIDIVDAALQFVLAAEEFASIIPGASKPEQVEDNVNALQKKIPSDFWQELQSEGLIYEKAQIPG